LKKERNIYSVVFICSTAATVILFFIMLIQMFFPVTNSYEALQIKKPSKIEVNSMTTTACVESKRIEISETDLQDALTSLLRTTVGFEVDTVLITNDTLTIMASTSKEKVYKQIEQIGVDLGNAIDVALKIAPEEIDLSVDLYIKSDREKQIIDIEIVKLNILGFKVPISLLPSTFSETISSYINDKKDEYGLRDLQLELKNGKIIIFGI